MECRLEPYTSDEHCVDISHCFKEIVLDNNGPTPALTKLLEDLNKSKACEIFIHDLFINDEKMKVLLYITTNMPWLHRIKKANLEGLWASDKYFSLAMKSAFYNYNHYQLSDYNEFQAQLKTRPQECLPCSNPKNNAFYKEEIVYNGEEHSRHHNHTITSDTSPSLSPLLSSLASLAPWLIISFALYNHLNYLDE